MANKKIVIIGGPASGKTTVINHLIELGETCYEEISRQVIANAQKEGIEQLFVTEPTLFSQKLLEGRIEQFEEAKKCNEKCVFLDRGIPDIVAYMNYVNEESPAHFIEACNTYKYDQIFILPPWEEIHTTDEERYESFEQAKEIHLHLHKMYTQLGYDCIEVPFGNIEKRANFILEHSKK